jgi:D-alanyl-D-alanine carboxypeptidase
LSRVESSEEWLAERSFRIGSVTKTFTAAVIFQLVEEGTLTLDDALEDWLPGYYDGVGVTLRHLLSNTSGIVSYNYVGSFDDSIPWTPEELVGWAVLNEPELRFEPGSQWEYSNTNFVFLGMIIEAATGGSYQDALDDRLLEPLGLTSTYVSPSGDTNPAIVDCYNESGDNLTNAADPSFGWAAGAIVSTPSDLARWGTALYGGDVLQPDSLTLMLTPTTLNDGTLVENYGLGAFIERDAENAIFGHTGGIAGYMTYLYFWETDRIALVVMANEFGTNLRDLAGYGWSVPLDFEFP